MVTVTNLGRVNTIDIKLTLTITDKELDDIMVTALEGGITYWCDKAFTTSDGVVEMKEKDLYLSDMVSRGYALTLHDNEEDKLYTLTKTDLLKGIELAIERGHIKPNYDCNNEEYNIEVGDIDANDADNIIQLALFQDILYC